MEFDVIVRESSFCVGRRDVVSRRAVQREIFLLTICLNTVLFFCLILSVSMIRGTPLCWVSTVAHLRVRRLRRPSSSCPVLDREVDH